MNFAYGRKMITTTISLDLSRIERDLLTPIYQKELQLLEAAQNNDNSATKNVIEGENEEFK